ncbi:HD domain-containing protein [Streptomyces sp. NBC_01260]|uniref:HD domain-containing protein n=1 Tax=unclassified Streptomyces TaxID=2593676 RepID=UPI000F4A874A|nr:MULTISPECIES: HD domain-containing protein [unclassified Streptomyces]MCX4772611.1 HD domain-containing protein [Streptomyces sp. NBC_01285]ROQ71416.1 HD domain-containing protein [Streptomyces sp. CEV 2-1]RPK51460.1 bifunctional (p)ppGpp synthetase II/ guanosine-3',5'-bis pyrophosphate 3'-pyrophosphohydrolase [Streptomyces sp. ADI92-24]
MTAPRAQLTLADVERIAREAHEGQRDKAGRPYAEHLAAVAEGVRARGGSDDQIAAAWLHDAVEDDALSARWLAGAALPQRVKDMVLAVSKRHGEDLPAYTRRILATPGALLIKESDLAHNADPARLAVLDPATRTRLAEKYAQVRSLLGLTAPETPTEQRY